MVLSDKRGKVDKGGKGVYIFFILINKINKKIPRAYPSFWIFSKYFGPNSQQNQSFRLMVLVQNFLDQSGNF